MTDLLVRPQDPSATDSPPDATARVRRPLLGGVLAVVGAAAVGLAVVEVLATVLGLGDGRSDASLSNVLHVGASIWLLAHGASLHLPDGDVTLIPLGITALCFALLHRAGHLVARRTPARGRRGIPVVATAVALPYAVLLVLLAVLLGRGDGPAPSVLRSGVGGLVLATVAAGLGAAGVLSPERLAFLRRGGRVLRFSGPAPSAPRVVLRAALVAGAVLAAGSGLLAAVSIASHLSTAAHLAGDTTGGALSSTGVLVVQLALLPNLLVWFVAYAAGPGFAVGSETSVRLLHGHLGEVPALPMFGGLPGTLPVPLVLVVLLLPIVAGVLAGRVVAGRLVTARRRHLALAAVSVGPAAGLLVAAAVALASGQVLGGDLAHVGASVAGTGLAVAVEIGLLALLSALGTRRLRTRAARRRAADPDGGAHRPTVAGDDRERSRLRRLPLLGRLHRPDRLHRPGWLRAPSWLRRPAWLRRRKVIQLPD